MSWMALGMLILTLLSWLSAPARCRMTSLTSLLRSLAMRLGLKLIRNAVSETARFCGCDKDVCRDIVIAVDEACQNVIRHAYGGSPNGEIGLEIIRRSDALVFLLRDFAESIDVSSVKPRDLDDIKPGGLGTHFMREVMDDVQFMPPPAAGGNLLRMIKKLPKGPDNET